MANQKCNNFQIDIKENGEWHRVNAIFPYTCGELLDERLDEAYVTFFSKVKAYKPLTEFRITFYKNQNINELNPDRDNVSEEYFILANDNSTEYGAGSGTYKHFCYLLERTKLLDGVLAPSLTFTNSNERNYTHIKNVVIADVDKPTDSFLGIPQITSPVDSSKYVKVPSVRTVGTLFANAYNKDHSGVGIPERDFSSSNLEDESDFSYLNIYCDGTIIASGVTEEYTLTPLQLQNVKRIEYMYRVLLFYVTVSSDYGVVNHWIPYNLTFTLYAAAPRPALKPYTITDCVNRVLELAEPLRGTDNPRFTFDGVTYTNGVATESSSYPVGSQAAKYEKIRAPEFTMTQSTLREQLKVIGSYIHAEPWLDENNVVHFLDYGSTKQSGQVSENTPYVAESAKTDINQYCTDIRSNAQNLVSSLGFAKGVIIEPAGGAYRSLRTETMYVRIDETNGIAATDLPIYSVQSVICGVASGDDDISGWLYEPKDITPYVFEATEYGANLSSFGGGYPYSKSWGIYYTQGQKGIRGLFYQDPDAKNTATYSPWAIANILSAVHGVNPKEVYNNIDDQARNLVFQITYKPIAPAFLSHGKQYYISGDVPYTQIYNQGDNLVETQYYGENMKGVVARLGNIEQERTFLLSSRAFIPRVGDMIGEYAISAVSVEYMPFYIKCTVGLSKDFNRISQYVGINSVKRMYEISERQAQKRDILIKEILLISDKAQSSDSNVMFNTIGFTYAINAPYDTVSPVKAALFTAMNKSKNQLSNSLLPCIGRSFGNTVHFAFTMKDNYSAGDISEWAENDKASGRWQGDAPYTDYYGRIYWGAIRLLNEFGTPIDYAFKLPKFSTSDSDITVGDFVNTTLNPHRLRKDNREIISYNIEVEYKTDCEDIIIGSALAERCRYINSDSSAVEMYLTNKEINKFAGKYIYSPTEDDWLYRPGDDRNPITTEAGKITLAIPNIKNGLYIGGSWVICTPIETKTVTYVDEDGIEETTTETTGGDILLAGTYDDNHTQGNTFYLRTLYFTMKRS